MLKRPTTRRTTAGIVLAVAGTMAIAHVGITGQLPFVQRENVWSIAIYESDSPFEIDSLTPVLTASDVTDVPALFVADPFMIQHDDRWFMFFEVLNRSSGHGDIGMAVSQDGREWRYERVVLDEPFHLSYPQVLAWNGEIYMVPESSAAGEIRLYRAKQFPYDWQLVETLVHRPNLVDPTVFHWQNRWWMFAGRGHTHDQLRLFHADELTGPWREHPQSPLLDNSRLGARPGGRVALVNQQLYRFGQDCRQRYGAAVHAFRITRLTLNDYAETPLHDNPLLQAQRSPSWNDAGMHHVDLHSTAQGWRAAVDGHTKEWRIRGAWLPGKR